MPYISKLDKQNVFIQEIDQIIDNVEFEITPGMLNYMISRLMNRYVEEYGLNYHVVNEVVGVIECAKQEFIRRVVSPYEDKKIKENGDVYSPELIG